MRRPRVFLYGGDGVGWSIDRDRAHFQRALLDIGYSVTSNVMRADMIYVVWWNQLFESRFRLLRRLNRNAPLATVITNDLESASEQDLAEAVEMVDVFVHANGKQRTVLSGLGVPAERLVYNPYYVSPAQFYQDSSISATEVPWSKALQGKFVIGSFQRDSAGADLSTPKWHKNPDLLVEIFRQLDADSFCLLLAGPRRHYLIGQCKKHNIPFVFVGESSFHDRMEDDLDENTLEPDLINKLYNHCDVYVVASSSEGGPKAILEAGLTRTPLLSTRAGMAPDLLPAWCLFDQSSQAVERLNTLMNEWSHDVRAIQEEFFDRVATLCSPTALHDRVRQTIDALAVVRSTRRLR